MSHSDSEEQFQEIKEFLAKSWKIIVAVIVIGLLAIWGWRYWQSHQATKMAEASVQYELLITKLNADDPKSVDELVTFAKETDSVYSVFASLKAAQFYVDALKDYTTAESLLIAASNKTDSAPVLTILRVRIARLQYQLGKYEESLKTLELAANEGSAAVINNVRGDVLVKMGRYQEACDAYNVALASSPLPEMVAMIKMKLNQAESLKAQQLLEQTNNTTEPVTQPATDNATTSQE